VMTAIKNKLKINLADSFWKTFYCYFGKRIILINCPFNVTKFVLVTHTGIPKASRVD
jgi:hypothetical protein